MQWSIWMGMNGNCMNGKAQTEEKKYYSFFMAKIFSTYFQQIIKYKNNNKKWKNAIILD